MPDAISSIQVSYTINDSDLFISSNPKIIADIKNWNESSIAIKIKSSAHESHPLPYDMSLYDQIKFVIPNHYLNCETRDVVRYYPLEKIEKTSINNAIVLSSELITNIINGYKNKSKLSIPLTAGLDSRTILSMFKDSKDEINTYTFFHENFNDDTADIIIPKMIANKYEFNHIVLKDIKPPNDIMNIYENEFGNDISKPEAQNSWTYYTSELREYSRLDGNVSPLAKANFGMNLPEFFATPSYLVTKTHNYSKENYKEVIRWKNDVNKYSKISNISKYDLFFWEHRVGKWTTKSLMNADLLIETINPFNCRELIEIWLSVTRKDRMGGKIHKGIIKRNWPELLDFPINPDNKYRLLYKNSFLFYLASRIKYIIKKNKY